MVSLRCDSPHLIDVCPSFHQILAPNTPSGLTINGIFNRYHYSSCLSRPMCDDRSCNASQGYWDGGGVMWSKQPPTPPPLTKQNNNNKQTPKPQTKNKTKQPKQNKKHKFHEHREKYMYVDTVYIFSTCACGICVFRQSTHVHLTAYMCIHGFFFLEGVSVPIK